MSTAPPVYLVDDDASLRNSIRFLLTNHGREVHSFDCGEAFLAEVADLAPGPVLLDVQMAELDGLDVQKRLAELGSGLPVVILTGDADIAMAVRAMKGGAVDFMTKPFARADLLSVLARADARLESDAALPGQRDLACTRLNVLTLREQQVLNELAMGLSNKSIGFDLGISPRTVEVHRAQLMRKLGVHNLPDALRIAFAAGMPLPLAEIEVRLCQPSLPLEDEDDPTDDPTTVIGSP